MMVFGPIGCVLQPAAGVADDRGSIHATHLRIVLNAAPGLSIGSTTLDQISAQLTQAAKDRRFSVVGDDKAVGEAILTVTILVDRTESKLLTRQYKLGTRIPYRAQVATSGLHAEVMRDGKSLGTKNIRQTRKAIRPNVSAIDGAVDELSQTIPNCG